MAKKAKEQDDKNFVKFGFEEITTKSKRKKVSDLFDSISSDYDKMNDIMSLGSHRLWKKDMINWMAPFPKKKLIDMACGTGDLGKLFLENTNYEGKVLFVDPNLKMLQKRSQNK